jgi:serine/threonine protein kinase
MKVDARRALTTWSRRFNDITFDKAHTLGHGTFANVYDGLLSEGPGAPPSPVAVKIPKIPVEAVPNFQAFISEVEIIAGLDHPCLLLPMAYGITPAGEYAIATPKMPTSLRFHLEQGVRGLANRRWDATSKSIVAYGIISGMAYLHARDVRHGDLKPENVLMTDSFRPRIGDFGEADGTPAYMAPELIDADHRALSKANDVYAWAIIYYEILTGRLPFSERPTMTQQLIFKWVKAGERGERKPEITDEKWGLLERCWHQDPTRRPTFASLAERPERIALEGYDVGLFDEYVHELRAR